MRIPRKKETATSIPLCSTADIAFLLLIFFMVLAKATSESQVDWKPANTPLTLKDLGESAITVIVDRQNNIFANGMPSSIPEMKEAVNALLGNRPRGQRQVLLKIDREVPARIFQQIMLDLGEVNAEIFRVLDPREEKKPNP